MLRQTSLLAFHSLDKNKIGERQRRVLEAIEDIYPACNRQIAEYLHWPINTVTPRTNELVAKGKVLEAARDLDKVTGRRVIYWRPKQFSKEFGEV